MGCGASANAVVPIDDPSDASTTKGKKPAPPAEATAANLRKAADAGDADEVRRMLRAKPAILNEPDNQGFTALFLAADKGNEEALGVLIEAGADINKGDEIGYTPLMAAAYYGHVEIVERLLTHQVRGQALRNGSSMGG